MGPLNKNDFWMSPPLGSGEWSEAEWLTLPLQLPHHNIPGLFVSKKVVQGTGGPLGYMYNSLENANNFTLATHGRPLRWALIDDESDDRSVARSVTFAATRNMLWNCVNLGECAYIGFTATPQATFHSSDNDFYPHYVRYLRYPLFTYTGIPPPASHCCFD